MVNTARNTFNRAKESAVDTFRTASKRAIQKTGKQLVTCVVMKLPIKLQNPHKINCKIVQRQLKVK